MGTPVIVAAGEIRAEPDKNNINEEYVVVRILKDLPTFTGADGRNYTVSAEEVVVLPQLNATGLIKRNAAKLIAAQESSGKDSFPGKN
jgi:DNA replication factor GINS